MDEVDVDDVEPVDVDDVEPVDVAPVDVEPVDVEEESVFLVPSPEPLPDEAAESDLRESLR